MPRRRNSDALGMFLALQGARRERERDERQARFEQARLLSEHGLSPEQIEQQVPGIFGGALPAIQESRSRQAAGGVIGQLAAGGATASEIGVELGQLSPLLSGLAPESQAAALEGVAQRLQEERTVRRQLDLAEQEARTGESRTIREERRAETRKLREELLNEYTNLLAFVELDEAKPEDVARFNQALAARGLDVDMISSLAQGRMPGRKAELLRERRSVTSGEQAVITTAADLQDQYFRQLAPHVGAENAKQQISDIGDSGWRLMANNRATIDPVYLHFDGELKMQLVGGGGSAVRRWEEGRRAQIKTWETIDLLEDKYSDVRQAVKEGAIAGPFIPEDAQSWLEFFGTGDPRVSAYLLVKQRLTAAILLGDQGARPSDFDYRNYLSLMPKTTEVLSGTGDMKLRTLREQIRISMTAEEGGQYGRDIARMKKIEETPLERELKHLLEQIQDATEKGQEVDPKVWAEFEVKLQKWQNSGRAELFMPPGSKDALHKGSLSPTKKGAAAAAELDRVLGGP